MSQKCIISATHTTPFFTLLPQIRAANLSGDCALGMEFMRGNLSEALVGQHKRCVRRRALLSVSLNPYCQVGSRVWVLGFRDSLLAVSVLSPDLL
jgi:hypothetical protein